jgi:hypothetical protein
MLTAVLADINRQFLVPLLIYKSYSRYFFSLGTIYMCVDSKMVLARVTMLKQRAVGGCRYSTQAVPSPSLNKCRTLGGRFFVLGPDQQAIFWQTPIWLFLVADS